MKKIVTLSAIAFLSTAVFAATGTSTKSDADRISALEKKIAKLEKGQTKNKKKISAVNKLANKDNLKFNVDFRTSYDNLQYETVHGKKYTNDALYSMRLWLNMAYNPTDDMIFNATLSANKAFGASYNQRATGRGYDTFDWIVNENLTDDKIRLKEAFWLWKPKLGSLPMTVSVGRRPATNGYLINLRDDDKAKSPMGHIINMEFDGASISAQLDEYVSGMYIKLCVGRGITNAKARFDQTGLDYTKDSKNIDNMDLVGIIIKPYDDGQYSVMTNYYRGFKVIGNDFTGQNGGTLAKPVMTTYGEMDGAVISAKVEGIGDEISDFLDETTIFASLAWSQTRPDGNQRMLGSADKESGTSYWIGTQMPNLTGGKFGLEYNHGSKYWRPFTYGEDTMIGSKMAVRGSAYEAYWTQPIIDKVFSMQIRYTYLDYDYTGSNAFFGDGGAPVSMSDAKDNPAMGDPVDTAQDIRVYFRYRY